MDMVRKRNIDSQQTSGGSGPNSPLHQSATRDTLKSEAMNSSLLMESSSISMPYEVSLIDLDIPSYSAKVPPSNYTGTR